jgi:hypothetical protein
MAHLPRQMSGWECGDVSLSLLGRYLQGGTYSINSNSTYVRTGNFSLRTNPSSGAGYITRLCSHNATNALESGSVDYDVVIVRIYMYIATLPAAKSQILALADGTSATDRIVVYLDDKGALYLQSSSGGSSTLNTGQWYMLELKGNADDNSSELKVDGDVEITGQAGGGAGVDFDGVRIGTGSSDTSTFDIYWDDMLIEADDSAANVDYPGPGQIVAMTPDGNGTDNAWTASSGTDKAAMVDELPPDSDTTYIRSTAVNNQTVTLESASSAGIRGTINAVKVHNTVKDESGATASLIGVRIYSGGNAYECTTGNNPANGYQGRFALIWGTDPDTSNAWTIGGLNALEAGLRNLATDAERCTSILVEVDYTPPSRRRIHITNG